MEVPATVSRVSPTRQRREGRGGSLAAIWTDSRVRAAGLRGLVLARSGAIRFWFRLLASLTGYAITAFVAWFLLTRYPGWAGRDVDLWLRVGAQVRDGISPYGDTGVGTSFYYAPPWAVLMGATTWSGKPVFWLLTALLEVAALRYIAGSWLRVGYFGLLFLTGAEIVSGAFNLVVAAGLAAAIRGDSRLAAFTSLAKLSPALAIREWRGPAIVLAISVLATVPVLGWWADWVTALAGAPAAQASLGYHELPLLARVTAAVAILAVWRSPRAGALAAAVAIPGLYAISVVLLYALVAQPAGGSDRGTSRTVDAWRRIPMLTARWRDHESSRVGTSRSG